MILAIYQTTELWFDEVSSHNFFSFISSGSTLSSRARLCGLDGIVVNRGENKTAVFHRESVLDTQYREEFDKLVTAAVNKGEVKAGQIDWTHIFNNKCVVYSFVQPISAQEIRRGFGISKGRLTEPKQVSMILLVPNKTENVVQAYVSDNEKTMIYSLKRADLAQKGTDAIGKFSEQANNCISSRASGFNIFIKNIFIPLPQESINTINVTNPVTDGVTIDTKALENIADGFFENPAVKWSSVINGVYSYSDEENVVKYNLKGVLEYSGYVSGSGEDEQGQNVVQNYSAALDFLKKDKGIKNDVVLKKITENTERTQFFFDYAINGVETAMSDELKQGLEMHAAIEMTVSRGSVVKYRRYLCVLEQGYGRQTLTGDFVSAVDNVYNSFDNNDVLVDDIDLAYKINGRQSNVPVCWQIVIDNKTYWEAA
ncbi:MAG: hypothetical protein IKS17_08100 [Firmicutes bacterium]|nr:hypothetical protein [Bacillota bacterium]